MPGTELWAHPTTLNGAGVGRGVKRSRRECILWKQEFKKGVGDSDKCYGSSSRIRPDHSICNWKAIGVLSRAISMEWDGGVGSSRLIMIWHMNSR